MNHLLTTPIYYASGSPHLGHAYTSLLADAVRRYHRLCGDDVLLLSGTDEHGQKIAGAAARAGVSVTEFVAARSAEFRSLWHGLGIDPDRYVRTTDPQHQRVVTALWQRLVDAGDIYTGPYEGLYCVECEQYFTAGDDCPIHRRPLTLASEDSWFFRLSRYREFLLDHIESHPDFIVPVARRNEVLAFLRGNALHDLSVSRTATDWGIPVPGDEGRVIYVWVDALASYLSGVGSIGSHALDRWWPATHFIGKDILQFHAVYWPALLASAGLPLPRQLVVNGWLTVDRRKIAKSDPATVIDPVELAARVGTDGLRYYLFRAAASGQDVNFADAELCRIINDDLANSVGNLVGRVTRLIEQVGHEGVLSCEGHEPDAVGVTLLGAVDTRVARWHAALQNVQVGEAAFAWREIAGLANTYLQHEEPWRLARAERDHDHCLAVLRVVHAVLVTLAILGDPLVPGLAGQMRVRLGVPANAGLERLGQLPGCVTVSHGPPLVPKLVA